MEVEISASEFRSSRASKPAGKTLAAARNEAVQAKISSVRRACLLVFRFWLVAAIQIGRTLGDYLCWPDWLGGRSHLSLDF